MKIGILGAGQIAQVMARTITLLHQNGHPEVELYAVGARDLSRAQAFAQAHGVEKAFGSYEAMLSDPDLDLVYIATPTPTITATSSSAPTTASTSCAKSPSPSAPARRRTPSAMPAARGCWSPRPSGPATSPCAG